MAQTIYRESFSVVLYKFRRSPEYTEILVKRFAPFFTNFEDAMVSSYLFQQSSLMRELEKKINQEQVKAGKLRQFGNVNRNNNLLRMTTKTSLPRGRKISFNLRQRKQCNDSTWAETMDNFNKFHMTLSAAKRNEFSDLAFKYAARYIASLLTSLGATYDKMHSMKSTRLPPEEPDDDIPTPAAVPQIKPKPLLPSLTKGGNEHSVQHIPNPGANKRAKDRSLVQVRRPVQKARETVTHTTDRVSLPVKGTVKVGTRKQPGRQMNNVIAPVTKKGGKRSNDEEIEPTATSSLAETTRLLTDTDSTTIAYLTRANTTN